ncbi:hypothetical protein F220043C3_50300 [Enterocloster asparagiformis]|uniref:RNA polymerase sigma factor n=1 Tax=Enterocloster asparagiformis TaxID=333367 RepID=UPI0034AA8979
MEQSIRELVERAKMGDQQAIAALYEKTSRKAYYLSLQLVKDQDQAQDILQDAFLKVFTNLNMLQQPENFQGWLDTIVINKSKDYLKKKKPVLFSQMTGSEEPDSEPDFEDERGYFSPEKQVDYQETKRLVQEMIDRLPEEQRMAVVLYYLENLSVGQIARLMECSEGTIKSRLNYGRKSIKAQVLALEKKGTKLYCMPLVPFLYWMFRQQILAAAAPKAVGAAVLQAAGAGAAAAGAGNAAGISAGTGAGGGIAGTTASGGTATGAGTAGGTAAAGTGAAGTTAAGAGTAGTTAAAGAGTATVATGAAGKAGLAFLGKALGVKGVAIVAAACVGVGAGTAGGVYVYKNHQAAEAAKTEAEQSAQEEEAQENAGGRENEDEGTADGALGSARLSAEEREILRRLYQAAEQRDYKALAEAFQPEFATLYNLEQEHFPGQYIIFDGQGISDTLEGHKLAVQVRSTKAKGGNHAGQTVYSVTCYQGDFVDGLPEGELLAYRVEYRTWSNRPGQDVCITEADYERGVARGTVTTECWQIQEDTGEAAWQIHLEGSYREDHWPEGMFEIGYPVGKQWVFDRNENVIEEGLTQELWFNVNVEYGDTDEFNALPESEKQKRLNMETGIGYLVPDTTGNYRLDNFELMMDLESQDAVFWSSKGSYHVEGTEGLFPFEITSAGAASQTGADSGEAEHSDAPEGASDLDPAVAEPYRAALRYPQYEHGKMEDRYGEWKVSASSFEDPNWNPVPSEMISHENYYEITNASIGVPYIVSADEFSRMKAGHTFSVSVMDQNGLVSFEEFQVLRKDNNGHYVLTGDESGYEEAYLSPRDDGTAFICSYDDDALYSGVIYMGSLYFSKNCKIYDVNGFDPSAGSITLESYMTEEHTLTFDNGMAGYEYGLSNGYIRLYGTPVFDPNTGLITEYAELYTP